MTKRVVGGGKTAAEGGIHGAERALAANGGGAVPAPGGAPGQPQPRKVAKKAAKAAPAQEDETKTNEQDDADEQPVQLAMVGDNGSVLAAALGAAQETSTGTAAGATPPADTTAPADESDDDRISPLLIGGVLLVGGGIAAVAAGGGGNGNGGGGGTPPANQAPTVAATGALTTNEDTPGTITVAATDPNGDALTYTAGTATNGTVVAGANGAFTYTPRANFFGTDTFTVTVNDGRGGTATQAITVTVTAVNDVPVVSSAATATVAENIPTTQVVYTATATDIESDAVSFSLTGTDAAAFAINATTGAVTFVASPNFEAKSSYSFNVVATETRTGGAASAPVAVTLTVTNVNEPPTITSAATATVAENAAAATVVYTVTATDPEAAGAITYSLAGADAGLFSIDATTGEVRLLAPADFETRSSYAISVVATDAGGLASPPLAIAVTVTDVSPTIDLDTLDAVAPAGTGDNDPTTPFLFDAGPENFSFTDNVTTASSNVTLQNFGTNDTLTVNADASNFFFRDNGTDIFVTSNVGGIANTVTLQGAVRVPGVLVTNEATAEQALGADFFRVNAPPEAVLNVNLDTDGDNNINTVQSFDASGNAVVFGEDANVANSARITNFGSNDVINASNATAQSYFFAQNGSDIIITANQGSGGSSITIVGGVRNSGALVVDEITAEQAIGFDFFSRSAPAPQQPSAANLDVDSDNNLNTPQAFSASNSAVTFSEDANVANSARVTGFSSDDVIRVTNATAQSYFFGDNGADIIITANQGGGGTSITLVGAKVNNNVLVFDEATAQVAVGGFDFFQFG